MAAPPAWTTRARLWPPSRAEREIARVLAVELHAQCDQLVDPVGPLVDEHAHRVLVAQPGTRRQGVGQVEVRRVLVTSEHRRDSALGPASSRLGELPLGQDGDRQRPARAHYGPSTADSRAGRTHGNRQARHAAPEHQHVEGPRGRP